MAVGCELLLLASRGPLALLPCLAALLPAWGTRRFLTAGRGAWPVPLAMGFIVATYLALVARAVLLP